MTGTSELFELHSRLATDCRVVGDLALSRLLLLNDARFPWCVLVPRRARLTELHHLAEGDRSTLMEEIESVSRILLDACGATKINVGALGNLVAQLHVHVVGRTPEDAAWPGPVWGFGRPEPYSEAGADAMTRRFRQGLRLPA